MGAVAAFVDSGVRRLFLVGDMGKEQLAAQGTFFRGSLGWPELFMSLALALETVAAVIMFMIVTLVWT